MLSSAGNAKPCMILGGCKRAHCWPHLHFICAKLSGQPLVTLCAQKFPHTQAEVLGLARVRLTFRPLADAPTNANTPQLSPAPQVCKVCNPCRNTVCRARHHAGLPSTLSKQEGCAAWHSGGPCIMSCIALQQLGLCMTLGHLWRAGSAGGGAAGAAVLRCAADGGRAHPPGRASDHRQAGERSAAAHAQAPGHADVRCRCIDVQMLVLTTACLWLELLS